MPNWCENILIVRSKDPKRLEEFDKAFQGKGTKWRIEEWKKGGKTPEEIAKIEEEY